VITIEPIVHAVRDILANHGDMPILLMSPGGATLSAEMSESLTIGSNQYCIICGHYEGIDARIFDFFDIQELSIGNYVLSSGELAALVVIDSIVRLIPGVLSTESLSEESFSLGLDRQKEYPQYSRPEVYE
jgi:tRNA (guanine37-N1)-methyltransferase